MVDRAAGLSIRVFWYNTAGGGVVVVVTGDIVLEGAMVGGQYWQAVDLKHVSEIDPIRVYANLLMWLM
jgi:hypothetical protein